MAIMYLTLALSDTGVVVLLKAENGVSKTMESGCRQKGALAKDARCQISESFGGLQNRGISRSSVSPGLCFMCKMQKVDHQIVPGSD